MRVKERIMQWYESRSEKLTTEVDNEVPKKPRHDEKEGLQNEDEGNPL